MMKSLIFVLLEKLRKQKSTCKPIHFKEKTPIAVVKKSYHSANICAKSAIEILEKSVKYVQS